MSVYVWRYTGRRFGSYASSKSYVLYTIINYKNIQVRGTIWNLCRFYILHGKYVLWGWSLGCSLRKLSCFSLINWANNYSSNYQLSLIKKGRGDVVWCCLTVCLAARWGTASKFRDEFIQGEIWLKSTGWFSLIIPVLLTFQAAILNPG